MMDKINNGIEYALYALAVRQPDLFKEAERFAGSMLAENQEALSRVRALQAKWEQYQGDFDYHAMWEGYLEDKS